MNDDTDKLRARMQAIDDALKRAAKILKCAPHEVIDRIKKYDERMQEVRKILDDCIGGDKS